ncbi:hypothetical protein BDW75DRAFT_237501 [Aspergillus navahoensis]
MGQTFCQLAKHVDALQHILAKHSEQVLSSSPALPSRGSVGQEPRIRALTDAERTEDDWFNPAGGEHIPAGSIRSTATPVHDEARGYEESEQLARLFAGVDNSWYPATKNVRENSQPRSKPQPLPESQYMTGVAPYKPLPLLPAMTPQPLSQTSPAAVKTKITRTTTQGKPQSRSLSSPGTRRPRSLFWYEVLGYRSKPVPGPITWEESVEDEVCIEGTGPFWSAKDVSIEGYADGRCVASLTSFESRERSVTWETELKVFRQAHELERAKNEVARLKERIKDLQAAGKMYRDDLIMATQHIGDLEKQWRRDNAELLAARGYIEGLEIRGENAHAELLAAWEYINELEQTEVQCECSRKRKWEAEVPGLTKKAKANEEDCTRRELFDDFWAAQEGR